MNKILGCVTQDHDLRLVAVSAVVCILGCWTTAILMSRAGECAGRPSQWWLAGAAAVFGCTTWSVHFIAMIAFMPGLAMAYDIPLTASSILVAAGGALAALFAWRASAPTFVRSILAGMVLGSAATGMHYVGVAAMRFSGFLIYDHAYTAASVVVSLGLSSIAVVRASDLRTMSRRCEVAGWLVLAICGLHFTGMTAITIAPGTAESGGGSVLGTAVLAVWVGGLSLVILLASLVAIAIERRLARRTQDLLRLRLLSDLALEALLIHCNGLVTEVNSAGERLLRGTTDDIVGHPLLRFYAESSLQALQRLERASSTASRPEEMTVIACDGTKVAVELMSQPIDYFGKRATAVALRDLTDRKRDEARIQHLARHDALTDLPNRYDLHERLGSALQAAAEQGSAIALVYIDFDRFKPVNDLHGHAAGDALLVQATRRIRAEIDAADVLARIGGDEFVIMVTNEPRAEKTAIVATRVIETLSRPFQIEGHRIEIGASIGIALFPEHGSDADTLMRAADAAMYRAKEKGRGAACFYESEMNAQLQARLQLHQELACAMDRDELLLHYQPIVNGMTGAVETFEALIRWNHPKLGLVPPAEFIALAEETGLIEQLGEWVIETAFREAAGWSEPWRISINVSPIQFRQSDLCGVIGNALAAHALSPARVVVEITEGVLIEDAGKAVVILNRLRAMGLRVALDDFGIGYSSLSYLQLFKFDKFKVDRSFVCKLGESDEALTIIKTIINLGHNLGLHVTAEGVETSAQLDILRALGCDQIQGYLVARPAPMGSYTPLDQLRIMAMFGQERLRLSA